MLSRLFDCFKKPHRSHSEPLLGDNSESVSISIKKDKGDLLTEVREKYPPKVILMGDTESKATYSKGETTTCGLLVLGLLCAGPAAGAAYGTYKLDKARSGEIDAAINQYDTNSSLLNPYYANTTCAEVFTPYGVSTGYDFCDEYDMLKQNFNQTFNGTVPYEVFDTCYQTLDKCSIGGGVVVFFVAVLSVCTGVFTVCPSIIAGKRLYDDYETYEWNNRIVNIEFSREEKEMRRKLFISTVPTCVSDLKFSKDDRMICEISKVGLFSRTSTILTTIDEYLEDSQEDQGAKMFIRSSLLPSTLVNEKVSLKRLA